MYRSEDSNDRVSVPRILIIISMIITIIMSLNMNVTRSVNMSVSMIMTVGTIIDITSMILTPKYYTHPSVSITMNL